MAPIGNSKGYPLVPKGGSGTKSLGWALRFCRFLRFLNYSNVERVEVFEAFEVFEVQFFV